MTLRTLTIPPSGQRDGQESVEVDATAAARRRALGEAPREADLTTARAAAACCNYTERLASSTSLDFYESCQHTGLRRPHDLEADLGEPHRQPVHRLEVVLLNVLGNATPGHQVLVDLIEPIGRSAD